MRVHHWLGVVLAVGLCSRVSITQGGQSAADAKAVSFWDQRSEVNLLAFAPDGKTMATSLEATRPFPGWPVASCSTVGAASLHSL